MAEIKLVAKQTRTSGIFQFICFGTYNLEARNLK